MSFTNARKRTRVSCSLRYYFFKCKMYDVSVAKGVNILRTNYFILVIRRVYAGGRSAVIKWPPPTPVCFQVQYFWIVDVKERY